jgi:tetratricopeptide (TPR) repeat protein
VATGLNNLGRIYADNGNYALAIKLYREALSIFKENGLEESSDAAYFLTNLADALLETGKLQEAGSLIHKAQRILRTADPALPQRDATDSIEGKYLLLRGSFPEAEVKLKASYEGLRRKIGAQSQQTQDALARLIRLYDTWGKKDLAAKYKQLQTRQPSVH